MPTRKGTPKDVVPESAKPATAAEPDPAASDSVDDTHGQGAQEPKDAPSRESETSPPTSEPVPADTPAVSTDPSAAEPVMKVSRAGRNLPAALAVGLGLGISLILILVFAPKVFIGVVSVAMAIATWEVTNRLTEADVHVPRIPLLVGGQAILWLAWPYDTAGVVGAFGGTVVVCMVWRLFRAGLRRAPRNFLRDTAIGVFVLAWIPLFASFAILTVLADDGGKRILAFMIGVVCSDVGGYAAGVLFGKHPMVPAISPKKSWEGFAGSLLFCLVGSIITATLLLDANPGVGVVLGVVLAFVATLGDLIESQVKRELQIKDMGTLLPGHGGIMDRLDSMLPAAVASWLIFTTLL